MITLSQYLILMSAIVVVFAGVHQLCIVASDFYQKRIRTLLSKAKRAPAKPQQVMPPKAA